MSLRFSHSTYSLITYTNCSGYHVSTHTYLTKFNVFTKFCTVVFSLLSLFFKVPFDRKFGPTVFLCNVQPKKPGMSYILMLPLWKRHDIHINELVHCSTLHGSNLHLRPGTTSRIITFPHLPLLLFHLLINLRIKLSPPFLDLTTTNHALEEGDSDERDTYPCEEDAKV